MRRACERDARVVQIANACPARAQRTSNAQGSSMDTQTALRHILGQMGAVDLDMDTIDYIRKGGSLNQEAEPPYVASLGVHLTSGLVCS